MKIIIAPYSHDVIKLLRNRVWEVFEVALADRRDVKLWEIEFWWDEIMSRDWNGWEKLNGKCLVVGVVKIKFRRFLSFQKFFACPQKNFTHQWPTTPWFIYPPIKCNKH
jgi:hypothetical protein